MKIAVAGLGYVGMSLAMLLAEKHDVFVLDISQNSVELVNARVSPVKDEYISRYLNEKSLSLSATTNAAEAFDDADFIIIATPTDYDPIKNFFDTSTVEHVLKQAEQFAPSATVVIKSTVHVGFIKI